MLLWSGTTAAAGGGHGQRLLLMLMLHLHAARGCARVCVVLMHGIFAPTPAIFANISSPKQLLANLPSRHFPHTVTIPPNSYDIYSKPKQQHTTVAMMKSEERGVPVIV